MRLKSTTVPSVEDQFPEDQFTRTLEHHRRRGGDESQPARRIDGRHFGNVIVKFPSQVYGHRIVPTDAHQTDAPRPHEDHQAADGCFRYGADLGI